MRHRSVHLFLFILATCWSGIMGVSSCLLASRSEDLHKNIFLSFLLPHFEIGRAIREEWNGTTCAIIPVAIFWIDTTITNPRIFQCNNHVVHNNMHLYWIGVFLSFLRLVVTSCSSHPWYTACLYLNWLHHPSFGFVYFWRFYVNILCRPTSFLILVSTLSLRDFGSLSSFFVLSAQVAAFNIHSFTRSHHHHAWNPCTCTFIIVTSYPPSLH